jgi:CPA1 family monovalent cation:H+ antiporter
MEQFLSTEAIIIELLLIVSIVAIAVMRLRIPYTVALVVVGLLITFQSPLKIELTPELILALFVPPLVAATDPVSVVALFRTLGVPKRLSVLIEGESLFNDGTAIVLFNLMITIILTGSFSLMQSLVDFARVSVGGIIVGLVLGWVISQIISRVDNYLIETTLTTILAFGSYLVADRLGVSGVLAVVAAGLVNGNISPQGMSPTSRIVIFNFWEYVAFLANSLVFLLLGLQIKITSLFSSWQPILWAILAILIARFIMIYGLSFIGNRFAEPIPIRWQHIMNWGGLRGAISLALVLSLPTSMGSDRDLLRLMAYGVVLFTLLVQSTTMAPLIRRLKIITRSKPQIEYETQHARLTALRSADTRLDRMHDDGLLSSHTSEKLKQFITQQASALAETVRDLLLADPALEAEEMDTGWRELLRAQRNSLFSLRQDGVISEEVFEQLTAEVDAQLYEGYPTIEDQKETRTQFLEITIPENSQAIDKTIAEIGIPRSAVLVSVERDNELIIPRGDTILCTGDVVTIFTEREYIDMVRELLLRTQEYKSGGSLPEKERETG